MVAPLFKSVLYQKSAYYDALIEKELPGVPVIAFHSYKGGVGRTLSLLAFVKAWYSLKDMKNPKKLLVVDVDIEAPGITWLTKDQEEAAFSFLDLLEITQEKENVDEIIELISDKMSELSIKIETEKTIVEHIVLPTYRYIEQLLDMYSSPESLAISYSKKYVLSEVLSKLGEKVNAELVLVDLRAGLSEFSAPLLFDPRVKKYLVTSTSYQSVKGTEILLNQLSKGLPLNENSKIPEILLTMVQEGVTTSDIISELVAVYDQYMTDDRVSITDDIVTVLPFASELVHLESLPKIMKNLNGRYFYKNIPPVRFRLTSLTAGHFPTTEYIRCIIRRRNVFMKLEISIKFIDENGMEATKPVTVDTSVPDFDDFHDVNDFLLVFDQLEKAGLKLRNESFSTALAKYMETMSKKNCTDSKAPKRLPHT